MAVVEPREHVEHLLQDYLELTPPVDWPGVRYQEHELWDSLVLMAVIADLEETYAVTFDDEDLLQMEDLDGIVAVLAAHGIGTVP